MLRRTLIVDDNAFFRHLFKEALQSRFPSMDIVEATNGEEALQRIKALLPDLIFIDIRLSGENGLELTRKIKAQYPDMIVNILTSYDLPEYREAAYQCKANHFIPKDSFLQLMDSIRSQSGMDEAGSKTPKSQP